MTKTMISAFKNTPQSLPAWCHMVKLRENLFVFLNLGNWDLFEIWFLELGISKININLIIPGNGPLARFKGTFAFKVSP
jgi:hypothetical protein